MCAVDPSPLHLELPYFKKHLERRFPGRQLDISAPDTLIDRAFLRQ